MTIQSFASLSNHNAKVLLLGTIPGVKSLSMNEYYGHSRNHFWKLLATIFNEPILTDYKLKKEMLLRNNIPVWDVIQTCERQGSLDSAITKEVPNDFTTFLNEHPNVKIIAFNGQKVVALFKKHVRLNQEYALITLPSTSPANASKSFEQKLKEWSIIAPSKNEL